MSDPLSRTLYTLDDEDNPSTSSAEIVWPTTILDQVYDNLSPDNKTLRQIIDDLHQEIITGGKGNIVFPVTSVNGQQGDVKLDKVSVGLGRVDNTRDVDKPLSVPQRSAIMDILKEYDFNVDLTPFYKHNADTNNPHHVSVDQINEENELTLFTQHEITKHSTSMAQTVHPDIRTSITRLWDLFEHVNDNVDEKLTKTLDQLAQHFEDENAHLNEFNKKESLVNKTTAIDDDHTDHVRYPTTRAVIDAIAAKLVEFKKTLPPIEDWIDSLRVVDKRSELPEACITTYKHAYFIKYGETAQSELAICTLREDGITYFWDISGLGWYSKFNPDYFKPDNVKGMSLNMDALVEELTAENGLLEESIDSKLSKYYTIEDLDKYGYVHSMRFIQGTISGTFRYYVNDDPDTMSEDISIAGLQRLAFLEFITEQELYENSVHSRHILENSLMTRHFQTSSILPEHLRVSHGYVLGNSERPGELQANEISFMELASQLRPLIGGYPDPNSPNNPWNDMLENNIFRPGTIQPGTPKVLADGTMVYRFTNEISVIPNMQWSELLDKTITPKTHRILNAGGSWMIQSDPEEWAILGGTNLTGHTFGTIKMNKNGMFFDSLSIGDRYKAPIDIWVQVMPL